MLVQYVRKIQAVHRPHKYGSGETGLIFTDGLAPSKSLPFLRLSFFPLIICLVYLDPRHFGAAGSPALCCGGTHMRLSSMLLNLFQWELQPAPAEISKVVVRNGVSKELSSKMGQIARETRAFFRLQGAPIWSVCGGKVMLTMLNDPSVCLYTEI